MVKVLRLLIWNWIIIMSMCAMRNPLGKPKYILEKIILTQFSYERIGFIKEYASGLLIYGTNLGVGVIQKRLNDTIIDCHVKYEELEQEKLRKIQKNEGIVSLWNAEKKSPSRELDVEFDLEAIPKENREFVIVCSWLTVSDQRLKKIYSFHKTQSRMLYCGHNDGIISVWRCQDT